jgi:pimeloyl-ACP methyl ester carboxylesterase
MLTETPLIIPCEEDRLVADLHKGGPEGVLLLSGWGGTRYGPQRILWQAAAALAEAGFTTLRFDFRGRGDSTGDATALSLDGMVADTVTAANWLHGEQGVTKMHLVGLCSGGNVALGAASQIPRIGDLVCWSLLPLMEHKTRAARQGTPRGQLLKGYLRKALRPEAWAKLLRGEANVKGAVKTLAKDKEGDEDENRRKTSTRDILADLAGFNGNIHLIFGSADPEAAGAQAFFEAWRQKQGIPGNTRLIPGAPHNYYTAQWTKEVIEQTVEWLGGGNYSQDG